MIDISSYKEQVIQLCEKFSVRQLDLVGSASRDDFDAKNSDIDVLIRFEGNENLFHRYFDLKFELEDLFGRKVDVLQESAVTNPYIKKSLERDRVKIYGS